jgi:hypothetical protein
MIALGRRTKLSREQERLCIKGKLCFARATHRGVQRGAAPPRSLSSTKSGCWEVEGHAAQLLARTLTRTTAIIAATRTPELSARPKELVLHPQPTDGVLPMIGGGVGFLLVANLNLGSCSGKSFSSPHMLHMAWYEPRAGRASISQ